MRERARTRAQPIETKKKLKSQFFAEKNRKVTTLEGLLDETAIRRLEHVRQGERERNSERARARAREREREREQERERETAQVDGGRAG